MPDPERAKHYHREMAMLERVADDLKVRAGVVQIADFGVLFTEESNATTCAVSAGIEKYDGTFRFRIAVSHARGASFHRRRVVAWPYSSRDAFEVQAVIADLRIIESAASSDLTDHRTAFGRLFDRLIRRRYLGGYDLASPIASKLAVTVRAEITGNGDGLLVTLKETRASRGISYAHIPQKAIPTIREAVEEWIACGA